jgi:uncharacterized membrane protein YciS (DUF1049 family)
MSKELNENTSFSLSIKTLIAIGFAMATLISMWFVLQADIADARELPKPDVTRMEFNMKDVNIRQSIENTEKTVDELKIDIRRIEDKIDRLR